MEHEKNNKRTNLPIGILYLGLYNQLAKKFGKYQTITRKEFFTKLGKHYMIPKEMRDIVIKEMVEMKLILRTDRDKLRILDYDLDLENEKDRHTLCRMAGLF